jgi:hypothetical protein
MSDEPRELTTGESMFIIGTALVATSLAVASFVMIVVGG